MIRAFDRTSRWGAIMLFDESDAFMTQRREDSLERNALVAGSQARPTVPGCRLTVVVLLRLLEYQRGIILLTTNRREVWNVRPSVSSS